MQRESAPFNLCHAVNLRLRSWGNLLVLIQGFDLSWLVALARGKEYELLAEKRITIGFEKCHPKSIWPVTLELGSGLFSALQSLFCPEQMLMEQSCRNWSPSWLSPMLSFYTQIRAFWIEHLPQSLISKALLRASRPSHLHPPQRSPLWWYTLMATALLWAAVSLSFSSFIVGSW